MDGWIPELKRPEREKMVNFLQRFKRNRTAVAGVTILSVIALMALCGPWISGYTYFDTALEKKNLAPCMEYWFGSDDLGRDLFTRVCYGARISLFVGITAALIDMGLGIMWGGIAGFAGKRLDNFMMRCADILYSLPYLLVVILLLVIMGPGLLSILVAMTIIGWITMARVVRGQVLQLKEQEFVQSAIILGADFKRILFKHILPNAMGPILVTLTLTVPTAIFAEAFLSFLGLGVQAPVASWGTLASDGMAAMEYYPWRLFFPALFISSTILAFNWLGEGLRDAFDVRERALLEKV